MSEPRNTREILAEAEHAASTGDFVSAEELLRDAAVRQEAELGPLHPDLANTLNNLAVAAEKSGRLDDAEKFYRRAVAIASAALPPDDPMVAASRQNLEDFCLVFGRPLDRPGVVEPAPALTALAPTPTQPLTASSAASQPESASQPKSAAQPRSAAQPTMSSSRTTASPPLPPVSSTLSRDMLHVRATLAVGLVGLVIAALFTLWLRSARQPSTTARGEGPSAPRAADPSGPARPAPNAAAPVDRTAKAKAEPKVDRSPTVARAPGAIQVVTAQLCRSFSTSDFRCNPAGDSVLPGAIVLLTRVRSPRDGIIIHQWYRGDKLRKTARLNIGANEAEGYRTYSRQTVDHGDWRVEVRNATGDLLYEQRLAVR